MSDAIAVHKLAKHYGSVKALDQVTLSVAKGEMLAVLGPSGCGKSTLLKVLAGLTPATGGEVYLGERRVDHEPPQKRGMGFVFQNYALFERMTVAENIVFGLRVRKEKKAVKEQRLAELLAVTGLVGQEHKYPRQLSGGQQQRVALARAMAPSPGVILLDEPLSALDIQVRRSLRHELKHLQQKLGVTTIIVTHDQEEAFELGDRVAVMNGGRLEQIGTPRDVYHLPQNEFVAGFVGENNVLLGEVRAGTIYVNGEYISKAPRHANGFYRVYLRPEDLLLQRESKKEDLSGLVARVREIRFNGATYYYMLQAEGGLELSVLLPRPEAAMLNLIPDDTVRITGNPNLLVPMGQ